MRVSSQSVVNNSITTLQRLAASLAAKQEQIATGRRIQRPSDDPVGSAQALDLRQSIASLDQYARNANIAENRLRLEEDVLATAGDVIQRVRELSLQAANATQTDETRATIAVELRQRLDELLSLANTRDAEGEYIFSGFQTSTAPFARSGGRYVYNGDSGQRLVSLSDSRQIAESDPGVDVFGRVREGNGRFSVAPAAGNAGTGVADESSVVDPAAYNYDTYRIRFTAPGAYDVLDDSGTTVTSGTFASGDTISFNGVQVALSGVPAAGDEFSVSPSANTNVFAVIDGLASALEQGRSTPAAKAVLGNEINYAINGLDQAFTNVLETRTRVGSRLAAIETQVDSNESVKLLLQGTLSGIEDLDYAEAISELTQEAAALEAAQQSFVRIQGLSLFNYLP